MTSSLREFILQYLYVVGATLLPVIFLTFVSMPLNLGGHPGEMAFVHKSPDHHMT